MPEKFDSEEIDVGYRFTGSACPRSRLTAEILGTGCRTPALWVLQANDMMQRGGSGEDRVRLWDATKMQTLWLKDMHWHERITFDRRVLGQGQAYTAAGVGPSGKVPWRLLSLNKNRATRPWSTVTPSRCEISASVSQVSLLRHVAPPVERKRATSASRSVDSIAKRTCGKLQ